MTITIHNMRKEKPIHPWDVRVDRTSILGNPFYMNSESQRDEVCDKYAIWLENQIKYRNEVYETMKSLYLLWKKHDRLRLFCWCAPKRCHAEEIKLILESN